jgi:hypothetical protein
VKRVAACNDVALDVHEHARLPRAASLFAKAIHLDFTTGAIDYMEDSSTLSHAAILFSSTFSRVQKMAIQDAPLRLTA